MCIRDRTGGSETVSLLESEIPSHNHTINTTNNRPTASAPGGAVPARVNLYCDAPGGQFQPMGGMSMTPAGGDQPHNNMMPYLTFYFNIALQGVFPPRT